MFVKRIGHFMAVDLPLSPKVFDIVYLLPKLLDKLHPKM